MSLERAVPKLFSPGPSQKRPATVSHPVSETSFSTRAAGQARMLSS
jgi:hypothetical protein